jgi:hypothetical protein
VQFKGCPQGQQCKYSPYRPIARTQEKRAANDTKRKASKGQQTPRRKHRSWGVAQNSAATPRAVSRLSFTAGLKSCLATVHQCPRTQIRANAVRTRGRDIQVGVEYRYHGKRRVDFLNRTGFSSLLLFLGLLRLAKCFHTNDYEQDVIPFEAWV